MTEHVEKVCKVGQGKECCRYLMAGPDGFECAKGTGFAKHIDLRVHTMTAQGDNCEGKGIKELN